MKYLAALLLVVALPLQAALPAFDSQGQPVPTLAPMLQKTLPGVVNVFSRKHVAVNQSPLFSDPFFRRFFNVPDQQPREQVEQALGSGVIVDAQKGYIITNHHVIGGADEISVKLSDGRTVPAKLVGSDPETDVAVLKIKANNLTALPLSDSDKLRVGDFVVAVGNPFGLSQTVTSGIVSAMGRSGLGIEGYEDFIQTDASINPGNSGGALVNLRGEVVGINTAILSKSGGNVGIGFAIPINMVRDVMGQLIKHGSVQRGTLGAQAQDLTPDLATAFGIKRTKGAVITQVNSGSPADKAGLKAGDIITRLNGRPVQSATDVRNSVGLLRIGQKVDMDILRDGKLHHLQAVVQQPKLVTIKGEKLHPRLAGAELANVSKDTAHGHVQGVVVSDVAPGSQAMASGLRKGDIIAQANRQPVTDLNSLQTAIGTSQTLLLNIQRRDGALFLLLR